MAASEAPAYSPLVRAGDTVIFDINGDRQAILTLDGRSKVKLGKTSCSAAPLIGCPYGSMFALAADGKSLERTTYVPLSDWDPPAATAGDADADGDLTPEVDANAAGGRSNAALLDDGSAQVLSMEDIEAMKAEGRAGADIVTALTANSATFANKTEFSQAKYKKKKAKKYIQVGTVRRPTAASVCEAYFASAPAKTSYLRADALALLLALANVGAHARVLVVECCGGLVTAAVAERLGGICGGGGSCGVASAWPGGAGARRPGLDMWRHFNFTPEQRAAIRFAPLHELLAERRRQQQEQQQAPTPAEQQPQQQYHQQQQQQQQQEEGEPMQTDSVPAATSAAEPAMQVEQQEQQTAGHASAAAAPPQPPPPLQPPFNCCILASSSVNPLALVRHVLPLLAPSASLAVFCPWQQPLVEALDALRGQGEVAGVALHESWWREMQVLPLRTHPSMNMNHGGGFILTGTVLAPPAHQQQQ